MSDTDAALRVCLQGLDHFPTVTKRIPIQVTFANGTQFAVHDVPLFSSSALSKKTRLDRLRRPSKSGPVEDRIPKKTPANLPPPVEHLVFIV